MKVENVKTLIRNCYMCFLVVYMIVREVMPLQFLINNGFLSLAIFGGGFLLILWDLFTDRDCLQGRMVDFFVAFLIIAVVSSAINYRYGFVSNIKCIAAMVLEYFVFFPTGFRKNSAKATFRLLMNTLIATLAVFVLISIGMYLFSIDYSIVATYGSGDQGYSQQWGRLWGVFGDPNVICYISLASLFSSVYFMYVYKKVWAYVLYGLNMLVQMIFIMLTLSRSGLLLLIVVPIIGSLYPLLAYVKANKKRALCSVVLAIAASGLLYGAYSGLLKTMPYVKAALLNSIGPEARESVVDVYDATYQLCGIEILNIDENHNILPSDPTPEPPDSEPTTPSAKPSTKPSTTPSTKPSTTPSTKPSTTPSTKPSTTPSTKPSTTPSTKPSITPSTKPTSPKFEAETIDRKDEKDDYSNGRFWRWRAGWEVFKTTPLFGTSPRNAVAIARERTPNTVMGMYGWVTHCSYLEVLVNTGILGAVVMLGALLYVAVLFLRAAFKNGFDVHLYTAFIVFITIAAGAVFISDVFFIFSISALLFFYLLGYLYHDTRTDKNGFIAKLFTTLIR